MSGLWKEGAGSGFGEVAGAGRLDQASGSSLRRRSGAGLGDYSRRRSLLGLVRPDRDRQARRSYAAAVNEVSVVEFCPALRVNAGVRHAGASAMLVVERRCPDVAHRRTRRTTQPRPRLVEMRQWQSQGSRRSDGPFAPPCLLR